MRYSWRRFSLRTLAIATFIVALVLGSLSNRASRQRSTVGWIKERNGIVTYRYQLSGLPADFDVLSISTGSHFAPGKPPVPRWVLEWLDINYFSDVVRVQLFDVDVEEISHVTQLSSLQYLELNGTQIGASEVQKLQRALPNCKIRVHSTNSGHN